jgi:hypothetical protein
LPVVKIEADRAAGEFPLAMYGRWLLEHAAFADPAAASVAVLFPPSCVFVKHKSHPAGDSVF